MLGLRDPAEEGGPALGSGARPLHGHGSCCASALGRRCHPDQVLPTYWKKEQTTHDKTRLLRLPDGSDGKCIGGLWLSLSWQCVTPSLEGLECGFPASHEVGGL